MRRPLIIVLILALAVGGGWWWRARTRAAPDDAAGTHRADAIPVLVASAERRDVPIWLEGLGTVQASATVTVRPQVDGTLIEVRFREGQDVRAGDVLARIDPRTYQAAVDQAVARKAQDQANLANARVDLGRYTKLAATAYTSAQQADTQKATVAQLEAQVAQDQAMIDTARAQLSYTIITSPIDGRTGIRQVDQGNLVHAADTTGIVVLTTLKPISVVFTLPQQDLDAVAAAQAQGTPEVLALPQGADTATEAMVPIDTGTLAVLDNQVDPATGTIKLKATFPNAGLRLWPGAFVTVRLKVDTRLSAIVVPPAAVQRGPQGPYLYVVNADLTASRRPVTVGDDAPQSTIVTSGLQAGERVVVDGASRLTDKAKVAIIAPPGGGPAVPEAPTAGSRPPETASRHGGNGAT
jgi:multidrug efflux system membrane fusion protein